MPDLPLRPRSFSILSLLVLSAFSAPSAQTLPATNADYSKEPFVLESLATKIVFESDGTSVQDNSARIHIQSAGAIQQFGLLRYPYPSSMDDFQVISVKVIKSDGSIVQTPPENIQDAPSQVTIAAPLYSDLKEKQIAVKGLEVGDILDVQTREIRRVALVPGQFWYAYDFFSAGICLQEELQISVPRDRGVVPKSPRSVPTISDEGGRRIYTWKSSNLVNKPSGQSPEEPKPDEPLHAVQITTFQNWDQLGQWYRPLIAPRVAVTPEVRAKAMELTRGATSDADRIRILYDYVATKFHYIGIDLGIGRYQPHAAVDVLNNGFGDCKDKHTLLTSLLEAVGIPAYPVLVNSTAKIDPDIPAPGQFDHMITAVPQGKDILWLDTTAEIAPLGYLMPVLRDKQVLLIPENGPVRLVKTPADAPMRNSFDFQIEGSLSDQGTLEARGTLTLVGDVAVVLRSAFRLAPQTRWNDVMQNVSQNLGFGGTVTNVTVSSPDAIEEPLRITYDYERKDYSDWAEKQITPPFPPININELPEDRSKIPDPIKIEALGDYRLDARIQLPADLVARVPMNLDLQKDFAEYHSSYSVDSAMLHAERKLTIKMREAPKSRAEDYRAFQTSVDNDQRYYVVLKDAAVEKQQDQVAELMRQVQEDVQRRDLDAATVAINRVLAIDPKNTQALLGLGLLSIQRGNVEEGIADFHKVIDANPNYSAAYEMLASALRAQHRDDDALEVWRQMSKALPDDAGAVVGMTDLLIVQKRFSEAVSILENATAKYPQNSQLIYRLGSAYLGSGESEKAVPTMKKAAEIDPRPSLLNSIAYRFAEADIDLPDALAYAQQAVAAEEDAASKVQLQSLTVADLVRMPEMAADWDTLGWVQFRAGNLAEAEKALQAAWQLGQAPVMADHLGQVYEKMARTQDAARYYAFAIAATRAPAETAGRLARVLGTQGKADAAVNTARNDLAGLRTVKLPRIASGPARAEFFVLFNNQGMVTDTKFISGDAALRKGYDAIAAASFDVKMADGRSVNLVRRGILDCEPSSTTCEFILLTPDVVRSLN